MKTQGRKNVHGKGGVRFKAGWDQGRENAVLRNLTTELIVHGHLTTTFSTAKKVQRRVERMVTFAKKGDLAARRQAARFVRETIKDQTTGQNALQKLFAVYGPKYQDRNGGYTRVLRLANRRGDDAPMAIISFVD